jgi:hypothetical protein
MSGLSSIQMDKRPFKGKGADEWLARLHRDYLKVVFEMEELSEHSEEAAGNAGCGSASPEIDQQRFLMAQLWREACPPDWTASSTLGEWTRSQQDWFEEVNAAVRLLNAKEVVTGRQHGYKELNIED